MELGNIIPFFLFGAAMLASVMHLKKKRTVTTTVSAGAVPAPAPASTPARKWLKAPSWSLLGIYGAILAAMLFMLILLPVTILSAIGDTYQTVAITMILIGLFLLVFNAGKRFVIMLMILSFTFLAFNKPEMTASQIEAAKDDGVTALIPKPKPIAAPVQQKVIWQGGGDIYPLQSGQRYLGILPSNGATFAQPVQHCVHAYAVGGQEAEYIPAGTQESNPWGRVLVQPKPNDIGKEFEVWAVRC